MFSKKRRRDSTRIIYEILLASKGEVRNLNDIPLSRTRRAISSKADRKILPSEILNRRQQLLELLSIGGYEDKGAPCFELIKIIDPGPWDYSGLARRLTSESAARYPVPIAF